jgi:hypothetical protein
VGGRVECAQSYPGTATKQPGLVCIEHESSTGEEHELTEVGIDGAAFDVAYDHVEWAGGEQTLRQRGGPAWPGQHDGVWARGVA